jgi:peptidoglycan/xylan/chitin deacetylase (PgdA/CDA1 family)
MEIKIDQVNNSDVTVIMYHYVRDIINSNYPSIQGLETQLFIEQIKYLKKNYNIITIEDLMDSFENKTKLKPKSVLLTFDDGYSDHYNNVFPILRKYNIQGSFYVPAKAVKEHKVLDVNKIHFLLASVNNKKVIVEDLKILLSEYKEEYNLKDFDFYFKKLGKKNRWDDKEVIFIKRLLQVELVEELRFKIIDILFKKYVKKDETEFAKGLYLNEFQIREMLNYGMHIGCHGYNHSWWNQMSYNDLDKDIDMSLKFLKNHGVDMSNWTAAYPYGSYNKNVEEVLKNKKCRLAFTIELGIANTSRENKLSMKRLDTNDIPKQHNAKTNNWFEKAR